MNTLHNIAWFAGYAVAICGALLVAACLRFAFAFAYVAGIVFNAARERWFRDAGIVTEYRKLRKPLAIWAIWEAERGSIGYEKDFEEISAICAVLKHHRLKKQLAKLDERLRERDRERAAFKARIAEENNQ